MICFYGELRKNAGICFDNLQTNIGDLFLFLFNLGVLPLPDTFDNSMNGFAEFAFPQIHSCKMKARLESKLI